jgi:hypothetical protein
VAKHSRDKQPSNVMSVAIVARNPSDANNAAKPLQIAASSRLIPVRILAKSHLSAHFQGVTFRPVMCVYSQPSQCFATTDSFLQSSNMSSHKLTHSGRRHKCTYPGCTKSFTRPGMICLLPISVLHTNDSSQIRSAQTPSQNHSQTR